MGGEGGHASLPPPPPPPPQPSSSDGPEIVLEIIQVCPQVEQSEKEDCR